MKANRYVLVRVLIRGSHINEIGGITCSEERLHSSQPESHSGRPSNPHHMQIWRFWKRAQKNLEIRTSNLETSKYASKIPLAVGRITCAPRHPRLSDPPWPSLFGQNGRILASFFLCEFMDLDFVSVHKQAKKELGQYPAILTSHLVNNPYIWSLYKQYARIFVLGHCLYREGKSFRNCELRGTDNVQGQISKNIFPPNGGYCLYYPSNLFRNTRRFQLHHALHNMSKKALGLFWQFRPSTSNYNDTLYYNLALALLVNP